MQPFTHTSIVLYVSLNHFMVLNALCFEEGSVFGLGKMLFLSSPKNSGMKVLDVP
jgi:hypothetical protein